MCKQKIVYASVSSIERPQRKFVEGIEDENSRDSFIPGLDAMQVDENTKEQCENPDVGNESLAKKSELVVEVESETEEKYVPIGREPSPKKIS